MNPSSSRTVGNRRKRALGGSVESRLAAYAAAAGAAGVGVLALAQPAQAQIVYTAAHVAIKPGSTFDLDLNHDGHTDLEFVDFFSDRSIPIGSLQVSPFASNQGQSGNAVEVKAGSIFSPLALNRGARIGGSKLFYGSCIGCNSSVELMAWADPYKESGDWVNVQDRFLGVKFLINHEAHYGWARLSVRVENNRVTALLTGYAYETAVGKPIIAGQTSGTAGDEAPGPQPGRRSASQVTQPASLGLLALGAPGVPLWRGQSLEAAK
jgi:hypothetical protein